MHLIVQTDFQRADPMQGSERTLYELVGGAETFRRLVETFYAKVEADPDLRRLFPADLESGKRAQFLFLAQFFGGPNTYAVERGHPRLRLLVDDEGGVAQAQARVSALDE